MDDFKSFKNAVKTQFAKMASSELFVTDVTKDAMWDMYLTSFPEGTNPIFRERTEHDCQCCKQFIRACGNVVAIIDNEPVSIWDINIGGFYQVVADAMSLLVKANPISDVFLHYEGHLGTDFNHQLLESGEVLTWTHFDYELPGKFVASKDNIGTTLNDTRTCKEVFKRSLTEITVDSANTALELIAQNSLYRGEEHKGAIDFFLKQKKAFDEIEFPAEQDIFCWAVSVASGPVCRIRNTAIGTLLVDVSEGKDLDVAVKAFESKVAPANYKRPTALITPAMVKKAEADVVEFGLEPALHRRYAVTTDLTINNVLFADRTVKKALSVFDGLAKATAAPKKLDKVEEVSIEDFISDILPKIETMEVLFENKHAANLVSLIAPVDPDAKSILKWGNNFTWSYNGEVTDSLRQKVQALGGRVDGVFRFTHSWNEIEPNQSLMDLHVFMPGHKHSQLRAHDSYGTGRRVGWNHRNDYDSGGVQDVDYTNQAPPGYIPVENITFPSIHSMPEGEYVCKIHNWHFRGTGGRGRAEIEFAGNIFEYEYPRTTNKEWITVARVTLKNGQFSIKHELPEVKASKEIWGASTEQFHKVTMVMNSPNHWDGEKTGNKHYFFMLEGCRNPEESRGFYNEFLNENLTEHRKVFEVLGSKMRVPQSEEQLSGLGFSSTVRKQVICKVTGSFSRMLKINF